MAVKTRTQSTVATNSGEAEYNALVRGATEALGVAAAVRDSGCKVKPQPRWSQAARALGGRGIWRSVSCGSRK